MRSRPQPLRAPAATGDAREPASPRILPPLRAGWQRLRAGHDRLNDSWIGDLIGVICIWVTLYAALIIAQIL